MKRTAALAIILPFILLLDPGQSLAWASVGLAASLLGLWCCITLMLDDFDGE